MYVLAYIDDKGNINHFTYENKEEAERYKGLFKSAVVVRVKE